MGILQTWDDILESIGAAAGNAYTKAEWFREINEPILELTCNLWNKYPKGIPFNPYARGLANSVCAQAGYIPPTYNPPPFLEGQCCDIPYRVQSRVKRTFNGNPQPDLIVDLRNVIGAITEIKVDTDPNVGSILYYLVYSTTCSGAEITRSRSVGGGGFTGEEVVSERSITREDGLPDDCGSLGQEYPDDPPRNPDDFCNTHTVSILDNQGSLVDTHDIEVCIDQGDDLNFPVEVCIGSECFNLDFDGLRKPDLVELPEDGVKKKPDLVPGDEGVESVEGEEEEGEEVEVEKRLLWVELNVTEKPVNTDTLWGRGAPDVYFLGWFEFRVDGKPMNRQFISFLNHIFKAPEGATGYAYTFKHGIKGKAIAHYEEESV